MYDATSKVLTIFTYIGILILVVGMGLYLFNIEFSNKVLFAGLFVLICAPFMGVLVTTGYLIKERDRKWAIVALLLIVAVVVGTAFTILV